MFTKKNYGDTKFARSAFRVYIIVVNYIFNIVLST